MINKRGGVLTQAPPGIDSIENQLKRWKYSLDSSRPPYLGVPHRLDRPTSGVMFFGQTKRWTRALAEQFENRTVTKTYWAALQGTGVGSNGTWADWMRKRPDGARSEIAEEHEEGAQRAILHFRNLQEQAGMSLLEISLETGRTHQIRLQASHHEYPVSGDDTYGAMQSFGPQYGWGRMLRLPFTLANWRLIIRGRGNAKRLLHQSSNHGTISRLIFHVFHDCRTIRQRMNEAASKWRHA
ncbi:MAG: RNA pseudouridine synthase [Pirellulaceae bacterium]